MRCHALVTQRREGAVHYEGELQVAVSVFGRFHAFDLAQQLQRRGMLGQLITTYPKFVAARWGIDRGRIRSVAHLEMLARAWDALPAAARFGKNLQAWFARRFDAAATRALRDDVDVLVGWSSLSLSTIRYARSRGIRTVLERGSSHIEYQTALLTEEFDRWGLRFRATHPAIVDRELQEYDEADRIAVPSEFVHRSFIEKGMQGAKLIRVPYGVSLRHFFTEPKRDRVFRIVHCGGISLRKGVPYLLQAFSELDLPNTELWLIGRIAPEMEDILPRFTHPGIVLKGAFAQGELRSLYTQCSVFCIASIEEGLAMVIAQAMASGLPVIHTPNSGGQDLVRDGIEGYCVGIRDIDALKEAIMRLYSDEALRSAMSASASERARAGASWDQYGDRIVAAYRAMVSS